MDHRTPAWRLRAALAAALALSALTGVAFAVSGALVQGFHGMDGSARASPVTVPTILPALPERGRTNTSSMPPPDEEVADRDLPLPLAADPHGKGAVQILDAGFYPQRAVGWLWIQRASGEWATCTGTLVGPRSVLTAAHCIYDRKAAAWATQIIFIPGATGEDAEIFGAFDYSDATILSSYVEAEAGPDDPVPGMQWDVAIVTLAEPAGETLGWFGLAADDGTPFEATMIGYPATQPEQTLWEIHCDVPRAESGALAFAYECPDGTAISGGAMFATAPDGEHYIRALNLGNDSQTGYALRLNEAYVTWITEQR
ncbi:MAG TPA: trypsin-like serine protease [Devosia sp.]|nr:trypsin-like serine protease [Devosia sp.]